VFESPARILRPVALAETVTYLVLLSASAARRLFDVEGATSVIGPVHGVVFMAYVALVLLTRAERGWGLRTTLLAIGAAVIPLGGWLVERRLLRSERGITRAAAR
jgi:integral membrane protein